MSEISEKDQNQKDVIINNNTIFSFSVDDVTNLINDLPISDETKDNINALKLDGYGFCFNLPDETLDELTKQNEHEKYIIKREMENLFNEECIIIIYNL